MDIKRNNLISAIIYTYEKQDFNTYTELLHIYYKLLEQEDINNKYINVFFTYDNISQEAKKMLLNK